MAEVREKKGSALLAYGERGLAAISGPFDWFLSNLRRCIIADGKVTLTALVALVLVLWLPTMLFPLYSPHGGVLRGDWTDHYHHNYSAWSFLKRGLAIYKLPLGRWHSGYPFEALVHWPDHPFEYPPGCLLLFLPTAIFGRFVDLSYDALGSALVLYLLALSQLSFFAVLLLLRECVQGGRTIVAVYSWVLLTHIALTGFYDGVWIGFAAMMLLAIRRKRPITALYWFAAASFISYRAAALVPFLLVALWQLYRHRPKGYVTAFSVLGLVGIVDVWIFYRILQSTKAIAHTKDYLNITLVQMQPDNPRFVIAMFAMALGLLIALLSRSYVTALTLMVATYLLHLNGGHFWRLSLLLAYPLAAATFVKSPQQASLVRSTAVSVCVLMGAAFTMVTSGDPCVIVTDLLLSFPPYKVFVYTVLGSISLVLGILFLRLGRKVQRHAHAEAAAISGPLLREVAS